MYASVEVCLTWKININIELEIAGGGAKVRCWGTGLRLSGGIRTGDGCLQDYGGSRDIRYPGTSERSPLRIGRRVVPLTARSEQNIGEKN